MGGGTDPNVRHLRETQPGPADRNTRRGCQRYIRDRSCRSAPSAVTRDAPSSQLCQRPRERRTARRTTASSCPSVPPVLGHLHRHLDAVVGAEIGPEQAEPDQYCPPATALTLDNGHPRAAVIPGGGGGSLLRPGERPYTNVSSYNGVAEIRRSTAPSREAEVSEPGCGIAGCQRPWAAGRTDAPRRDGARSGCQLLARLAT